MELTMQERKKLTMGGQTYLKAGKTKKSVMLDDFCEEAGYCRRHAARVLHQAGQRYLLGKCILVGGATKRLCRHRPPQYGPVVQKALITIWSASTFLGPVRLGGGMPLFVENPTAHVPSPWALSYPEHPSRWQNSRSDRHGPSPPLLIPGVLAVDLVGHDGGQVMGDFGWTLTVTDCTTRRPQAGTVRTKAEIYVVAALESCLHRYPRRVVSLHSDNGSEFMNGHLARFCIARRITFTRSRPYQGNDNPHVEEKNNSVIRKFVGYDRHDTQTEVDLLNRTYRFLHLLVNWFLPSQKLLRGEGTGSHITKVYNTAQTLCARMLARQDTSEETKKRLRATCAALDMTTLPHEIFLC